MKYPVFLSLSLLFSSSLYADSVSEKMAESWLQTLKANHQQDKIVDFFKKMPKGADLHNHQAGASWTENMVRYGKNDNLCINKSTYAVEKSAGCTPPYLFADLENNSDIYNNVIDAWSMRNFIPNSAQSGHDHFFHAFTLYNAVYRLHENEFLTEVVNRASQQNEVYLELMHSSGSNTSYLKPLGDELQFDENDFQGMHDFLLSKPKMQLLIQSISSRIDSNEKILKTAFQCGTEKAQAACNVKVGYMLQGGRGSANNLMFIQLVAFFAAAHKDPRLAGINMVGQEDHYNAIKNYNTQMKMIGWLHDKYPDVKVSLHAGELNAELTQPENLRFHIRNAVEIARADRIGHGVDLVNEDNYQTLLEEMKAKHILVEINLTSNDGILNIKGQDHPFPLYLKADVPVALATDDEGITRSDLSSEYVRAFNTYDLDYLTLKKMTRNSLEYSFLKGKSLWSNHDYALLSPDCANDTPVADKSPSEACKSFLKKNAKAERQWQLEENLNRFEKSLEAN